MIFKCTKKVRTALKINDRELPALTDGDPTGMDQWYCHLFYVDRRKCLIWMHAKSLFVVLAPDIRQADFRRFDELFRERATFVLSEKEGFGKDKISRLIDTGPDIFAKTDSRTILGSLNDQIFGIKYTASWKGGYDHVDFDELNYTSNRTPMGALKYQYSIDCLKLLLSNETSH